MKKLNLLSKLDYLKIINKRTNLITVFLLLLICSSYILLISRNKFETRSKIIIRSSDNKALTFDFQSLISSGGASQKEASKYLEIYLNSFEAMLEYDKFYPLSKNYRKKGLDLLSGLSVNVKKEKKLEFYKSLIKLNVDSEYGVLKISTYGYSPEQSYKLNVFLIERSKSFINQINKDINKEQLKFAKKEAAIAKDRVTNASNKLQEFQSNNKLISITSEIETSSNILSNLENELVSKKVELSNNLTKYASKNVPEIYYLEEQIKELEKIIKLERENIVSPKGRELNKKAARLKELIAEIDFSTDLYKTVLTSLESSRINSIKNQRFITILSQPFLPDKPYLKWKYMLIISIILISIIIFSILNFIKTIIESHLDNAE